MIEFRQGIAVGIATMVVAIQAWLGVVLDDVRGMYHDFGNTELPAATRLVLSPAWRWGVVAAGLAGLVWLVTRRPRGLVPYVATVIATAILAAATYHYAYLPLHELAENIKG